MFITMRRKRFVVGFVAVLAATLFGLGFWHSGTTTAHAAPVAVAKVPVRQQVGYAGQISPAVTGQFPVIFRLYDGRDALLHEETINADVRQGRFQVFVGAQGDLNSVLKDSQQMKVFFQGSQIDSLAVIHASQEDIVGNAKQFSSLHAVILTNDISAPAIVPTALAGTCSIIQSGFFTVPFTNTLAGTSCGGCGRGVLRLPVSDHAQPGRVPLRRLPAEPDALAGELSDRLYSAHTAGLRTLLSVSGMGIVIHRGR